MASTATTATNGPGWASAAELSSGAISARHTIVALVILAIIGGYFWQQSRYPALLKKLNKGASVQVRGAITFDDVVAVDPAMPLAQRVGYTAVNWVVANKQGMTFGFLFSAGILLLIPLLQRFRGSNPYLNVVVGTLTGIPLGVCANCVAPVGQSLYQSGISKESTLATMVSSPTLNPVVLAMVFALFPLPVAGLKIGLVLLILFGALPLLFANQAAAEPRVCELKLSSPKDAQPTWGEAIWSSLVAFSKNLWYMIRTALPLMVLAALLGALVIELLPRNLLAALPVSFLGILVMAIVATFLPVPMSFDVFASFVAWKSGVPLPYVVTMLCTLGAYSVYSLLVTGRNLSWKTAGTMYGLVAAGGIVAGVIAMTLL